MSYDPCNPRIKEAIEEQGFYVCNFERHGQMPEFSYTVGFTETWGHPEMLVMGLNVETNSHCLVQCAELVEHGERLTPGWEYSDIVQCPVQFVDILPQHIPNHFGFGLEYYGKQKFKALQLVWPDNCLLYTSPSPRDATLSRMPSSA